MRSIRPVTLLALGASACALIACSSSPDQHIVFYGPETQPTTLVSLSAGDSLGREIYINDVVLAARQNAADRATAVVASPIDDD